MIPRSLAVAILLGAASAPVLGQQKCTPPPTTCDDKAVVCGGIPNVSEADLKDAFDVVVSKLQLDADLKDQAPWGKPVPRQGTIPLIEQGDKIFNQIGSPAAAFSANTGINNQKQSGDIASHDAIYMHLRSLADIAQNRAELVALIMHEGEHLKNHHPEKVEKHNGDSFEAWCSNHSDICPEQDSKTLIAAWDHDTFKERAAFQAGLEQEADAKAQDAMKDMVDPRTQQPFPPDSLQQALASAEQWLKAQCESLDDPTHGSLADRIDKLREQAKHQESIGNSMNRAGTMGRGVEQALGDGSN